MNNREKTAVGVLLALFLYANSSLYASGEIIFESGMLGQTGITGADVLNQVVLATNVSPAVFDGVAFELAKGVKTTSIGGHFVLRPNEESSLFGAIVQLDDENDFPDSEDLSTPDVLGTTLLSFPEPSAEVFGDLSLRLEPGWYGLVFGSGLFDTTGLGGAPRNNTDIGTPRFIGFQSGSGWGSRLGGKRFVVKGDIVPETSSANIFLPAILVLLGHSRLGRACRVAGGAI